jgi:ubiquinone/menaquinone biosynthesis C-methylase UbiE
VGCGRGGGASYLSRYHHPAVYIALDLTLDAVRMASRNHGSGTLKFVNGDAENLPFAESVFDAVINVESCHCYEPIEKFFAGVLRVLAPGGALLLTDFRDLVGIDNLRRTIVKSGLNLVQERNISKNVLRALELESDTKMQAIHNRVPQHLWPFLEEFGAVRSSTFYRELQDGGAKYMSYILTKPQSA